MVSGWTIFLVLTALYLLVAYALTKRPADPGEGPRTLDLMGPFLLLRTRRGRALLNRLAQRKRWWRFWGDAGIAVTVLAGAVTVLLLLYQVVLFLTRTEEVVRNAPEAVHLIGIPGVNPIIPIGYGILGLLVALVVHEGAHGVLSRVADLRVKSLGLVFFIVPVGAFVEPHEEDLERASAREKNRVFAAGPMANIAVGAVVAILFSQVVMAGVAPANGGAGVGIVNVVPGSPADEGGLEKGTILTGIAGHPVENLSAFQSVLANLSAGEQVQIVGIQNGERFQTDVVLADKHAYYEENAPEANDPSFEGQGFLGVGTVGMNFVAGTVGVLKDPLSFGVGGFLFYISYPFLVFIQNLDLLAPPFTSFLEVSGTSAALGGSLYVIANSLYWIFWINLMLGTFNALPMSILDGGHMFKTSLRSWLLRRAGVDEADLEVAESEDLGRPELRAPDPVTQVKLDKVEAQVSRASWTVGLTLLFLILLPILAPTLVALGP